VKVFYDPHDEKKALLAHDDYLDEHKTWIIAALAIACVASAANAGVAYYLRGSHLAQRISGGMAVVGMTSDAM
jgi:hypothetical protein